MQHLVSIMCSLNWDLCKTCSFEVTLMDSVYQESQTVNKVVPEMVSAFNCKQVHPSLQLYLSLCPSHLCKKPANGTVSTTEKFTGRLTPKMCFSFCSLYGFSFHIYKEWPVYIFGRALILS